MARSKEESSSRFPAIAYSVGLAIIFSASILNLCMHKLPPKHLYSLPSFLVYPYEQAGNMGVTLVLAGMGLSIMVMGFVTSMLSGRTTKTGGQPAPDSGSVLEMSYSDPRLTPPVEATASSGGMVLETSKYLGKKPSALPGSTVIGDPNQ